MSGARAAAPADIDAEKGRVKTAKVQRYWAGKRPDTEPDDSGVASTAFAKDDNGPVKRTPVAAAVVVKKADPRLARLARTNVDEARDEGHERRRREIQAAEVVRARPRQDDSDEEAATALTDAEARHAADAAAQDEEAVEAERQLRRQRALDRQRSELAAQRDQQALTSGGESEEDSEYESESEDEAEGKLAKPVFVAKIDRDTIAERERLQLEEQQRWEADQKRKEERKKETSTLVAAIINHEIAASKNRVEGPTNNLSDIDTSDDDDEDAAAAEYLAWQRRELARIKREQALREVRDQDALERERLAAMSEAERAAYAAERVKEGKAAKMQLKFLQKYYHKGAFFQHAPDDLRGTVGGESIFKRDFSGATGEDKFDKTALPSVMQVRNFGRAGRTKWTHLANEDTSVQQTINPYVDDVTDTFEGIKRKMEAKGAGLQQVFAKPKFTRT